MRKDRRFSPTFNSVKLISILQTENFKGQINPNTYEKVGMIDLISVDKYSVTPKYLQIVNSVKREIESGNIQKGEKMPSINELSIKLDIARDTVERGYKHFKNSGIIEAVPRRGYFIKNIEFLQTLKIFLLFNKLSAHKKTIYDSFAASLGENALIDFYIYNNNFLLFKRLLSNKKDDYSHYVIIPHFIDGGANAHEIINTIPKSAYYSDFSNPDDPRKFKDIGLAILKPHFAAENGAVWITEDRIGESCGSLYLPGPCYAA